MPRKVKPATPRSAQEISTNGAVSTRAAASLGRVNADDIIVGGKNAPRIIEAARLARGLSQAELTRRAGYSAGHVCRVERGRHGVTLDFAKRIAAVLNGSHREPALRAKTSRSKAGMPTVTTAVSTPAEPIIDDIRELLRRRAEIDKRLSAIQRALHEA